MPHLIFLIICAIWGSSFILMKKAGLAFGPVSIGAWRVFGGAAALGVVWWLQRNRGRVTWRQVPHIVVVGLVGYTWPYAVQPYLVIRYGSGFVGMMVAFVPLLTILVSVPMLGAYPTRRQLLGVCGGLGCVGLVMSDGLDRNVPASSLALAITVPLAYAVGNTYVRLRLQGVPAVPLTAIALAAASLILCPMAAAGGTLEAAGLGDPAQQPATGQLLFAWLAVLILGVIGTGITTFLFNHLILDQGPLFASMVTYLIPLGALLWGQVDSEVITQKQIVGLAGVLIMVAFVQIGAGKRNGAR